MVAGLTARLGPGYLDLAEEVVQEAMLRALQIWPIRGVPPNPAGWLFQVARNRAIDRLRRDANLAAKLATIPACDGAPVPPGGPDPLGDAELQLIFLCCHPDLPAEGRVALTLKVACGFGVGEIARAFLTTTGAIAQRLVRAKRLLRDRAVDLTLPAPEALRPRVAGVLDVVYLTFNEGYGAHVGDDLIRADLCREAIRLAELLATDPRTTAPEVHALLALMHLHASRLPARVDAHGAVVLLADQDRGRWDQAALASGFRHLERSAAGSHMTAYHVEAAIAAVHAAAPRWADTDWARVLALYDQLLALRDSPVVRLNRSVALGMIEGPAAALEAATPLLEERALAGYYLLPATLGDFAERLGRQSEAAAWYRRAAELPCTTPERRLLQRRLARLTGGGP